VADPLTPEARSRVMSRVRGKNTRPELALRRALWAAGVRGWRCHARTIIGTPDLSWKGRKLAVFVDSAWWHGHPSRYTPGRHPPEWDDKIQANMRRDELVNRQLAEQGWTVIRIWDFELDRDPAAAAERVKVVLARATP
jgi:DNA mismatch endonuclease (patch repair protein)